MLPIGPHQVQACGCIQHLSGVGQAGGKGHQPNLDPVGSRALGTVRHPLSVSELIQVLGLESKTSTFKRAVKVLLDQGLMTYLERVADLEDGFETSYGMDFLTSPHWSAVHKGEVSDAESAVTAMACWNNHKRRLFQPERILLICAFIINERFHYLIAPIPNIFSIFPKAIRSCTPVCTPGKFQ